MSDWKYKDMLMTKDRAHANFNWLNQNSRLSNPFEYPNYMKELNEVLEASIGKGEDRIGFINA